MSMTTLDSSAELKTHIQALIELISQTGDARGR